MDDTGLLFLSKADIDGVKVSTPVTDTNFHHLAVTKSGTTVIFYIDGTPFTVPAYGSTFTFGTPAAIGARGDNQIGSFLATLDEVSIYNRALTSTEIQSIYGARLQGKTIPPPPPAITSQPASLTRFEGETATFNVSAVGTMPLNYQWWFNGGALPGKTGSSLIVTNVQSSNAGPYWLVVSNSLHSVTSSNAVLAVAPPPPSAPAPAGLVCWWRGE